MTPATLVLKSNQVIASGLIKLEGYTTNKWFSPLIWIAVCFLLISGKAIAFIEKFIFITVDAVTPPDQRKWIKLSAIVLLFFVVVQVKKVGEGYRAETAVGVAEQGEQGASEKPSALRPIPPMPKMPTAREHRQ